jgi:hypothetical protein
MNEYPCGRGFLLVVALRFCVHACVFARVASDLSNEFVGQLLGRTRVMTRSRRNYLGGNRYGVRFVAVFGSTRHGLYILVQFKGRSEIVSRSVDSFVQITRVFLLVHWQAALHVLSKHACPCIFAAFCS